MQIPAPHTFEVHWLLALHEAPLFSRVHRPESQIPEEQSLPKANVSQRCSIPSGRSYAVLAQASFKALIAQTPLEPKELGQCCIALLTLGPLTSRIGTLFIRLTRVPALQSTLTQDALSWCPIGAEWTKDIRTASIRAGRGLG